MMESHLPPLGLAFAVFWHVGAIFLLAALLCAAQMRASRTTSPMELPKRTQAGSAWLRFLSFAGLTPAVLILAYFGPLATALVFLAFINFGLSEFWQLTAVRGIAPYRNCGWILATGLCIATGFHGLAGLLIASLAIPFVVIVVSLTDRLDDGLVLRMAGTALGLAYVGVSLGFLPALRWEPNGYGRFVFVVTVVQIADVAAYFGGIAIGRTALAPRVSPSKTREGLGIGIAAACAAAWFFHFCVPELSVGATILLGAGLAVFGLLGDLSASALKRSAELKDFGHVIPGHGGVLDRLDSLILAGPLAFAVFRLVG